MKTRKIMRITAGLLLVLVIGFSIWYIKFMNDFERDLEHLGKGLSVMAKGLGTISSTLSKDTADLTYGPMVTDSLVEDSIRYDTIQ